MPNPPRPYTVDAAAEHLGRTPPTLCVLPTHVPAAEAEAYQAIHELHCADNRPAHSCAGKITIDRLGITLSCPRCGDHRSLFPVQA